MESNELGRLMPELGKIEQADVRKIWPNEALDFTPWLFQNLGLLGEALRMDLAPVQREAPVGDFSLDILAEDRNTGVKVAIENQLEGTDHGHLGQVLTHAAGYDARIVIWVTPEFREEHRAALDWLNHWTPEEIAFYGVEVGAIKIGSSLPAPEFRPVAFPNGWSKQARQRASSDQSSRQGEMRQFFTPLSEQLLQGGFADRVVWYQNMPRFPTRSEGVHYVLNVFDKSVGAFIRISKGSAEAKNRIFDALHKDAVQLEAELDAQWFWDRWGNQSFARLGIRRDGSIDDPPERLEELGAWLVEHLPKLKTVLNPHLERILGELDLENSALGVSEDGQSA